MFSPPFEYPRPDFDRSHSWQNLNGEWDFRPDPEDRGLDEQWYLPGVAEWTEKICVPFPWESEASQIEREWLPIGWYRRRLETPADWRDQRTILNIGAAHYECRAWCNGEFLTEHIGGYLPFSADLTDTLDDRNGELILRIVAPVDKRYIPHGKQRSRPVDDYDDCAFTANSGIWQTVWLEKRPTTYIDHISMQPAKNLDGFVIDVSMNGHDLGGATLTLTVDGQETKKFPLSGKRRLKTTIPINEPHLWSPNKPHLYFLTVALHSEGDVDRVQTYSGLRRFEIDGDRFLLNSQQIYLRGVLDQGYWPGSGYTPPHDGSLKKDIELAFEAGYNLVRKHLKFEDPRWLFWADKLGMLVWAEPPSTGRFSHEAVSAFEGQLAPMVRRDGNHPSIVIWGLYNEEWGLDWRTADDLERQQAVERAYELLAGLDHSRPIVDDSGWWHVKSDILDWHYYDMNMVSWQETTAALAADQNAWFGHQISETDWYETQLIVPGREHQLLPIVNSEYGGGPPDLQGWIFRWQTQDLRRHNTFSGYVYTELYDVEHEIVGIFTADRKLKELGCDPAIINADTIICFALTPVRPGIDYLTSNGQVKFGAEVSHHGQEAFVGKLRWGWAPEASASTVGEAPVIAEPYKISSQVRIETHLPSGHQGGRLHVWLLDQSDASIAYNFIDVASADLDRG